MRMNHFKTRPELRGPVILGPSIHKFDYGFIPSGLSAEKDFVVIGPEKYLQRICESKHLGDLVLGSRETSSSLPFQAMKRAHRNVLGTEPEVISRRVCEGACVLAFHGIPRFIDGPRGITSQ
jgi:hypothetical protein